LTTSGGDPITFAEWGYLARGSSSAETSLRRAGADVLLREDTLFGDLSKHEIFTPVRGYPPQTVSELPSDDDRR